jgi:hypothetical protein
VQVVAASDAPNFALEALTHSASDLVVIVTVGLRHVPDLWLDDLARVALQTRAAAVAPRIVNYSGLVPLSDYGGILFSDHRWATYAHKGIPAHSGGYMGRNMLQQRFTALSPAVLVVQRQHCLQALTAAQLSMGLTLTLLDWQLRWQQAHLSNLWAPEIVFHLNDKGQGAPINVFSEHGLSESDLNTWFERWGEQPNDPAYNPNLSSDGDFSLNWAQRSR